MSSWRVPVQLVVMGVSGSGKSTIAALLAARLGAVRVDADDFHPAANVAKMRSAIPLDDEDRRPWLEAVAAWLAQRAGAGEDAVAACSALKRAYRDILRSAGSGVLMVHLAGPKGLVVDRLRQRRGHFMPPELLCSQYADLEPLGTDEPGVTVDFAKRPEELVADALRRLGLAG